MLNKRTNVLFSEDEHDTLVELSKKRGMTMGELVRRAVRKTYKVEDKEKRTFAKSRSALRKIEKLKKQINTKGLTVKEIKEYINEGRRY